MLTKETKDQLAAMFNPFVKITHQHYQENMVATVKLSSISMVSTDANGKSVVVVDGLRLDVTNKESLKVQELLTVAYGEAIAL